MDHFDIIYNDIFIVIVLVIIRGVDSPVESTAKQVGLYEAAQWCYELNAKYKIRRMTLPLCWCLAVMVTMFTVLAKHGNMIKFSN